LGQARKEAQPSTADGQRTQQALVARLGPLALATTPLAAGGVAATLRWKWLAKLKLWGSLGALSAVASTTALVVRHELRARPAPSAVQVNVAAPPTSTAPSTPDVTSTPAAPIDSSSEVAPAAVGSTSKPEAARRANASAKSDSADDVDSELSLLSSARTALAAHRPDLALQALDRDAREHPASPLREERAYTRIRALCELGRSADARRDADRFIAVWPTSLYRARIERSCAKKSD
jgi:hypothetical protein